MGKCEGSISEADRLSPRARRRQAMLDAAEALFIEQGYDRTALADIVRRSGGSLATLYELFGNKQGLLHAIAARWRDQALLGRSDLDSCSGGSHVDTLLAYVARDLELRQSPRAIALMRMLVSECLRDRDFAIQTYRDLHMPAIRELSDMFAEWTAAGEAHIDDPEAAAHLFFSIITGDSMLNTLAGVEDGMLDEAQLRWRLQPFFSHFRIDQSAPPPSA